MTETPDHKELQDRIDKLAWELACAKEREERWRRLLADYEKRISELGEMLSARENERRTLLRDRDELGRIKQYIEGEDVIAFIEKLSQRPVLELETRIAAQRRELALKEKALKDRNMALDALHYVWCSGGCICGVHRFGLAGALTEEVVAAAESNTRRLRAYWESAKRKGST